MRRLLPAFLCCAACSNGQPAASPQADSAALAAQSAPTATDTTLIAGTPPGDLADWVADMRAGLDTVAAELKGDRAAVQKRVIDIYVTRQEYAEQYYGPGGRMAPTPALAESIKTAEDRFHELMLLTNANPPAGASAIRAAIDKVQQQLARVAELTRGSQRRVRGVATTEAAR